MQTIFLFLIWLIYISSLFIFPIADNLSYIFIAINLLFSALFLPKKNYLNTIFFSKYLFKFLPTLPLIMGLAILYGEIKIFFYLLLSILSCWMGFLLGSKIELLPLKNIIYPFLICLLTFLGVIFGIDQTYLAIGSILLLVPWLIIYKKFFLFWIFSFFNSFIALSRAVILALFFTVSVFNLKKKFSLIITSIGLISLIIIFLNIDQISFYWEKYIMHNLLISKPMEESRTEIWSVIINNLNPGTFLFGQSDYVTIKDYSAHNGYLQTYIKFGFIGLILIILIPFFIIKNFINLRSFNSKILVSITFLYFMREIFIVSIIENTFYMAGLFWFIVGILFRKIELNYPEDIKMNL